MKYKVILTTRFNQDVTDIADALCDYPNMGKRIFQEMEQKIDELKDNPFIWPFFHGSKYRRIVLEGHMLFYIVDEAKREVRLYHLYYTKRDIFKLLDLDQ